MATKTMKVINSVSDTLLHGKQLGEAPTVIQTDTMALSVQKASPQALAKQTLQADVPKPAGNAAIYRGWGFTRVKII